MPQRSVIALGLGVVTAGVAAIAGVLASGSMGPGRLAEVGPSPLPFALALGGEVLLGAAILLLSPRHRDELAEERTDRWLAEMSADPLVVGAENRSDAAPVAASDTTPSSGLAPFDDTAPLDDLRGFVIPKRDPSDRLD
jgi:hypothetical protein